MDKSEKEVQARVEFTLNEIRTAVVNSIKTNSSISYALVDEGRNIEGSNAWEHVQAYREFLKIFDKEVRRAPPSNNMSDGRFVELRNKAVDQLMDLYPVGRGHTRVGTVVRIVEGLLNEA